MSDRRRHLRVLVPGAYCELLVDGMSLGNVPLEDVSDSGVFVAFPRPMLAVTSRVQLRFTKEEPPLVLDGTIAQVMQPGGARTPGYGIELMEPPSDAVERVAAARAPVPHSLLARTQTPVVHALTAGARPTVGTESSATSAYAAAILGAPTGQGPAMAQALTLFGVRTLFSADPKAMLPQIGPGVRVVLAELALLDSLDASIAHVRSAVEKGRVIVAVELLPDVHERAKILRQGADELLLLPCDVFTVMRNMHAIARRPAQRS